MSKWPVDLRHRALLTRNLNSLHGFNAFTDGDDLILATICYDGVRPAPSHGELNTLLSSALGEKAALHKQYKFASTSYGGNTLSIPVCIREEAPRLIDAVRGLGYRVRLQTKLGVTYGAVDSKESDPVKFSKEASERLALQQFERLPEETARLYFDDRAWYLSDERLWCTAEGKALANKIRVKFPHRVEEKNFSPLGGSEKWLGQICDYDYPVSHKTSSQCVGAGEAATVSTAAATATSASTPAAK